MDNEYQIRRRIKDQSSDEEDSGKDENVQSPISSVNRKNDEPKKYPDLSNGDFSMFKTKQMKCDKNEHKGIVMHCDALQRLGAALSVYATITNNGDDDEIESEDPIFAQFVGSEYRVQFMEDFNHFMEEHQGTNEEIKQEMIAMYGLKDCTATECELTTRHFSRRRANQHRTTSTKNIRPQFYRKKFDSLHFHIFHLEESGYRYRNRPKLEVNGAVIEEVDSKVNEEEDDEKAVDQHLKEEVAAVNEFKKKCEFGRFQGDESNKYTLNVSAKTWMDSMFEYVRTEGVPLRVIERVVNWLNEQGFDTDAVKEDINEHSLQNQQSSTALHIEYEPLCKHIVVFIDKTKVPTFSVGLRFIYWQKCKGYKLAEFEENDSLYIDGAKYENIKEELLNSGHCDMLAFTVLMTKCNELMLCKKVKRMKASKYGTSYNPGYGIKRGDPITKNHVQCVVAYCDLTEFCTAYSATFRSEFVGESVESIKKRNQSFFNISKGLREAVECFGNNGRDDDKKESGPFYCGMKSLLLLTQFGIRLNGPTSTSKCREVAIRFAGEEGVVLKMNNDDISLCFFDCVPFSQYPEEQERLFIGGRFHLAVKSVLTMKSAQNFSRFFGVLSVFDCVVSGVWMGRGQFPPTKDHQKLQHLLDWCFGHLENDKNTFPEFIYRTFECFRENKTEIVLAFHYLGYRLDDVKVFYEPVLHSVARRGWEDGDDNVNMLKWDNIFAIFPNIKMVTVRCAYRRLIYGICLPIFVRTVCDNVFPKYPKLESVAVKGVDAKAVSAATEEMGKVVSECKVQLLIQDGDWGKTLILNRE